MCSKVPTPKKRKIQEVNCDSGSVDNNFTRGQVDLIDLSHKEFNGMRFVMQYKDLSTNFSHFRAVSLVANREVASSCERLSKMSKIRLA